MTNLVDKICATSEWFTPPEILIPVRALFGGRIDLDPCTTENNPTGAMSFYTKQDYAAALTAWTCYDSVFCNPPYGKEMYDWIERVVTTASYGTQAVLLLAASSRWDQAKWQRIFSPALSAMCMPIGRVKFLNSEGVRKKNNPYPSLLFFYNTPVDDVARNFQDLGKVVSMLAVS